MAKRLVRNLHIQIAKTARFVRQRMAKSGFDVGFVQRTKLKQPAARHDSRRHGDDRIFRSGTDKTNHTALNGGQNGIGLRLGPTMALVQQKIGTLPVELHAIARLIDDLANIPYAGGYRIELLKSRRSRMRNDGG